MSLSKLYVCKQHVLRFVTIPSNEKRLLLFLSEIQLWPRFSSSIKFVSISTSFINTSHGTFSIPLSPFHNLLQR
jgi:hypothetical protein